MQTQSSSNSLVPTRYLLLMAHLILVITLLTAREENVKACLSLIYNEDEYYSKDTEFIVALSLSITFIALELITFGSGLTMFSGFSTCYSILAHAIGVIFTSYFTIDGWDCGVYWWIFSLCICAPLIVDLAAMLIDFCAYEVKYK